MFWLVLSVLGALLGGCSQRGTPDQKPRPTPIVTSAVPVVSTTAPSPPSSVELVEEVVPAKSQSVTKPLNATPMSASLRKGPIVTDDAYSVWLEGPDWIRVGARAVLRAVVTGKAPYRASPDYSHRVFLDPAPPGVELPVAKATDLEWGTESCSVRVPVLGNKEGTATVQGELQFSVCTERRCRIERRRLSFDVVVRAR
jgi:hypothetical protein